MLSYFLCINGPASAAPALLAHYQSYLADTRRIPPEAIAIRAFQPTPKKTAVFDDRGAPRLLVQVLLPSPAGMAPAFEMRAISRLAQLAVAGCRVSHQLFELREEPLTDARGLAYGTARQSLSVRYFADDNRDRIRAFRAAYLDGHPAVLAGFPGIRRVFCYVPVQWYDPSGIAGSGSIVGNEVVFDSMAALNRALHSPAMARVRRHSQMLPRCNRRNTHFPMSLVHEQILRAGSG
jgi:hypothetical protein